MAMQFTESEWLIMSSLSYVIPNSKFDKNGYPIANQTVSVTKMLDEMKNQSTNGGMNKEQFANLTDKENYLKTIDILKTKFENGDFVVTKCINHNASNESGLVVFSIEPRNNVNGDVIVCCRGSDSMSTENLNDWVGADGALAWDTQTQQQKELEAFMNGFGKYNNVYLTGHSLGGNLAMYGAVSFPYTDRIAGVYAFDGPGFNQVFIAEHIEVIYRLNDRIHNFQNEHDLVSSSLISIGHVIVIESAINSSNVLTNHNRWSLATNSDGSLRRNKSGKKDVACQAWNAFTTSLSGKMGSIALFSQFQSFLDRYRYYKTHTCRDFSRAAKDMMTNAAKETENEHWWDVTKWDCWYRVQQSFGSLKWDLYAGKVDSYYRKLIDINDASVKDINRIFDQVYAVDNEYANKAGQTIADIDAKILRNLQVIRDSIIPSLDIRDYKRRRVYD